MATELAPADRTGPERETGAPKTDGAKRRSSTKGADSLGRAQKAAIVVRLLLAEGITLPLAELPDALQAELATQISQMRFVDRDTLHAVLEEFATELDSIGLSFPGGLDGALEVLDGAISPDLAARLRSQSGALWDDPWTGIRDLPLRRLCELLERESAEIGAVILSKLDVARAADCLGKLPGPVARRLTLGMSETAQIEPDAVRRIGLALVAETKATPPQAFSRAAVDRLGAILDISTAPTREDVLAGLAEEDEDLAQRVRAAIFTFADIPDRIADADVPNVASSLDQAQLVTALCGGSEDDGTTAARDFMLDRLPGRLADNLRNEIEDAGTPEEAVVSEAQIAVVRAIRELADKGDITLKTAEEDGDDE